VQLVAKETQDVFAAIVDRHTDKDEDQ
jgi:hypothetical protein